MNADVQVIHGKTAYVSDDNGTFIVRVEKISGAAHRHSPDHSSPRHSINTRMVDPVVQGFAEATTELPTPTIQSVQSTPTSMRVFDGGATRHTAEHKHDYEGFLSPVALRAFGEYMHRNRMQADGSPRDSDDWQKGIPLDAYMKSAFRHFFNWWELHRGFPVSDFDGKEVEIAEALCGLLFNVMGYLHEICKPIAWDDIAWDDDDDEDEDDSDG